MKALHLALAALLVLPAIGAGLTVGGPTPAPPSTADAPRPTAPPTPIAARPAADIHPAAGPTGAQVERSPAPPATVNALGVRRNVANRSGFVTAYVDLGPALDAETAAASHRLETIHAVDRVEAAESDAERTERLRAELRAIEERADALGRAQGRAFAGYVDGERTAEELLLELAAIDREARALDDRRQRLWRIANRTDASIPDERFAALGRELDVYEGPVRARAAAAITGETAASRFYVAAAPRNVVLATLTGDAYLREAYRGDLRRVGEGRTSGDEAADVVAAGYPEVWQARKETTAEGGRIARVGVDYTGGRLEALVGSGNDRVFVDEHRQSLATAGTGSTAVNTRDGLQMRVNRSYPGGAMQVVLRDTDGNRVNASVTIGPAGGQSVTVGHTGDDGELWLLTPSQRFTVVAIRGQSVVFLTMSPLATPEPGTTPPARNGSG
ncbi:MAG: hypothetical protein ABEH78_05980 [Haloferacaceae archaeon]